MDLLKKTVIEILVRLILRSPKFFVGLQWLGGIVGTIAIIPKTLAEVGITPPDFLLIAVQYAAPVNGYIIAAIAMLPVDKDVIALNEMVEKTVAKKTVLTVAKDTATALFKKVGRIFKRSK